MTDLNSTSTGVVVGAGQTLNILSPGGTAIDLTNNGTVNGFRLSNSGGEVQGFENFSLMQASGANAFLFLSGNGDFGFDFNAKGATIRALATGSGNTTTVEVSEAVIFNSGTIAAIGSSGANATVDLDNSIVEQASTGRIVASGNGVVDFSTSEIVGGTLATVGSNASAGVFDPGAEGDFVDGTVAPNTNIGAVGLLIMEDVTFGTNDTVKAYDGGIAILEDVTPAANDKFIASGGSLAIVNDGSLVLKSGTLLLATSNGFVSATANDGALTNSVGATIEALANTVFTSAAFVVRGSDGVNNGGIVAAVASGAGTEAFGLVDGGSAAVNNSGSMVASGIANGSAFLEVAGNPVNNKKTIEALATSNGSAFLEILGSSSVTNGGTMVASATFDGFAGMEVEGSSVVNSGTFGAFANHEAFAFADVYANTVINTKIMVASANDESEAELSVDLGVVGETFVNSKGGTFGALATSNSFAFASVEGLALNNGGTIIALARANSEANTSVFFEEGTNSGTIVAKAGGLDGGFSNAILRLDVPHLNNSGGTIFASATGGGSAIVDITGSEIFGGLLKTTVGTGTLPGRPQAWIGVFGSGSATGPETTSPITADAITAAAFVLSATIQANIGAFGSGAFLELFDDTIKSGTLIEAASGGSVFIEEDFTISAGVTIQALNSGGAFFDTEVTIAGGSSVINNGNVKALNLATASGGTDNVASVSVEANSVTNNATMLAANSGGVVNAAIVDVHTDTFTNKGSFKAVDSGGFENFAGGFVLAVGSATNSGTIAAIDSGGTQNRTSVSVEGSSFTNAASGIVQAVVSGGTSGGTGNTASALVEGVSNLTNNGSMVASANGGQGHLGQSPSLNTAFLEVEAILHGATLTNNKTILGAATSGGSTFVDVFAEIGSVINKGVISGSANSGSLTFLDIFGSSVVNSKTIAAQATVFSEVEVLIGGSSITNAVSGSVFAGATSGSSAFLDIEFGSDGTFTNSGSVTVSASASSEGELFIRGGTVTNAKTIQVVANGQSDVFGQILADTINNSGLMAASAGADSTATLEISGFVNNKGGKIVASGVAEVTFDSGTTVSGGTLATTGSGLLFVGAFNSGTASVTVEGATITSGSTFLVEAFGSGASAVLTLSGGDTIGKGAIVEAESGGIVSVTGTVTNSGGTFLALTSGTVDFTSTSNVNGNGVAVVQNGIVEIDGGGTETVDFTATGSGGLDLTSGNLYQGIVSGFGGPSHQNTAQFIDFRDVPFVSGTTSAVFVADATHPTLSGTLEIVAGTTVEATVELAGNYTNTIFNVSDDGSGGVKVTDPPGVTGGGTTTVTGSPTGGTVASANPALFGNYMASMFATSAFNGGTLLSDLQTALQPQLAPSHH